MYYNWHLPYSKVLTTGSPLSKHKNKVCLHGNDTHEYTCTLPYVLFSLFIVGDLCSILVLQFMAF